MKSLAERWRDASLAARAELLAATWETGSVLLFISAVFPAAFDGLWPSLAFVGGLAGSALLGLRVMDAGAVAWNLAAGARVLGWLVAVAPLAPWNDRHVLVTTCGFGVMAGVVRRAVYRRAWMRRPEASRALARSLAPVLGENAAVVGIVGGHLMLLFCVAYLRTESVALFRAFWELIPALALLGTLGFTLALGPLVAPVAVALEAGPEASRAHLASGLARARGLSRRLAAVNFALWFACITIGVASIQSRPGPRWADVVVPWGLGVLFSWGVSFYQRGWHDDALRPVVTRLSAWVGESPAKVADSLRRRLMSDFGKPVLFTLTLWLLSSVGLYRNLGGADWDRADFHAIAALFASFVVLVIAVGTVFLRAARELSEPLARIERAAEAVARGRLDDHVPAVDGPAEVRALGRSIEDMREALARTIASLEAERAGLEVYVERRTAELRNALAELREAQAALVHGERMALLGQLVAGVAHEIHNPLNAVAGSISSLERIRSELGEILAAYGRLEATLPDADREAIATLRRELDVAGALDDLDGIAKVVRSATSRGVAIVDNLKGFARAAVEPVPVDLHEGLRESLLLFGHPLREAGIRIEVSLGGLPEVSCCAGEINQVFVNLLANARDAIVLADEVSGGSPTERQRRIRLETRHEGEDVVVTVADDGLGVEVGLDERIFEPFFTTKASGRGTGLGLSISREIVARHGGSLRLLRVPGELLGATFECRLPVASTRGATGRRSQNKPYQARQFPC
ncbi:MAG: HAMP domain-containing protein [Deltaproteobacteria bacterium]|nr:HAMP domain-containing protein [Deltaproteobacteria bacterium]